MEDKSLHLRYNSSGEDENSSKRKKGETTTSDNMAGACDGPEDIPDEPMSALECSRVTVSRSSTPSNRSCSNTPTNLASTPCSSRTIIPTFLSTPLSGEVRSIRSPTPVTEDISRKEQTTASANKQSRRDGYQQGITEKGFIWRIKNETGSILKYKSAENKEKSGFIIEFVKGQYPDEVEGVVREGIKTNFESFKTKKRREETGKQEEHNKKMAVYNRMRRKEKGSKSLVMQYMSYEQTDSEDEGSFIVRPLPWRSDDVDKLVKKLGQKHDGQLTKRSRRQHHKRKVGAVSSRIKPEVVPGHEWVFK
ncbi:unnamed protein product [Mytilus coruscus]|uniref:Uncharacterized protein n=1 Tax=Mytilus coruscus TaxID=42192 RepID=A0A6J8CH30_MYTCO|nr:unnamed protein product [Mytilus coruscus]